MIDQTKFKSAWALLCERFGRTPSRPLMVTYYRSLSPRMTTEQFEVAAQRLFDGAEFFPRPDDFAEAGGANPEAVALEQWELVQDLMRGFEVNGLTAESQRIIRMLGGEYELRMTPLDRVPFVRRDFLQLYGEAAEIARRANMPRLDATAQGDELAAAALEGPEAVMALAEQQRNGRDGEA